MKEGRKWTKVVAWIAGSLAVLLIAGIAGWHWLKKDVQSKDSKVEPAIEKTVARVIKEESDSLYTLHYDNFDLDINKGFATISNVKINMDTSIYNKLKNSNKLPNNLVAFTADKIMISHFGFDKVNDQRAMHIGTMTVVNPNMHVTNKIYAHNDTVKNHSWLYGMTRTLFKSIDTDNIIEFKIDHINMKNSTLIYVNNNEQNSKSTTLKHLDITITDVSSGELANTTGTNKKDAAIRIGHQRIVTADKLYYVDFDNLRIVPTESKIYVGSFALTPTVSKAAFEKIVRAGKANYRYHFKFTGISMTGFDFDRFYKRQQFYINNVTIDDAWLEFYSNYNWPLRTPPDRRNKYPNELLQRLAFDITIPKMVQKHADLYIKTVALKSQKEAVFSMNDVYSVNTNITNNTAAKKRNAYSTVLSRCKIMNAGLMKSKLVFNLVDKDAPYTINSEMGQMDAAAYNPLSEPLGLMQIKSGEINKMEMQMKADEWKATGNIDLYYKGMKVNLLKRDEKDNTLKKRSLFSFFTNIVLPNDNPKKNGKFRKGPINIVRDNQESFFGFIWRGILDGTSSAMSGADQNKDEPGNKVLKLGKIFAGPKRGQETKSTGGDKKRLEKLEGSDKKKKE